MSVKHGPFTVSAVVILGCLVGGVALVTAVKDVPAVVVAVVLACGIATLTYTLLGGVSEAGFHLGPLSLTGSGAMLVGSAFLINNALDPQLMQIRRENRADQFGFNFDQHAAPPKGWFALNDRTGVPLDVTFTDPVTNEVVKTVKPPPAVSLPLKLAADEGNDRYVVLGTDAGSGQGLGYVTPSNLITTIGSLGWQPGTVYGFQRLYLARNGELPEGMERRWGNTECRGSSMPFQIEVVRFSGFADYDLRRCNAAPGAQPDHSSSLRSGQGELVLLTIQGQPRSFLIAVVAADHQSNPPWSTFFAVEMLPQA